MADSMTKTVTLSPVAHFCIKCQTVEAADVQLSASGSVSSPATHNAPNTSPVPISKDYKVFLNICYDAQLPKPPTDDEKEIRRTMMGEPDATYFVPMIVSGARQDVDKSGKSCLIFDCIFNPSLKSRATKDHDFRTFITEIALENVEEQSGLVLSREIGTPNIASKGTLLPRQAKIPTSLPAMATPSTSASSIGPSITVLPDKATQKLTVQQPKAAPAAPRIVELSSTSTPPQTSNSTAFAAKKPKWRWNQPSPKEVVITIDIPGLATSQHPKTTLDLEARRLIFTALPAFSLDASLKNLPADLDVDSAKAQWVVADEALVIKSRLK